MERRDVPDATPHALLTSDLTQNWSNISLITADDNWSAVPSIQGFRGDNLTTGIGVDPRTILADGHGTPIDIIANRTNTNLTTGGVAEFHLANPVVALQGSGTADAPHLVMYLDATSVSGVMVSFKLRDIDGSANNAVQQVAVQYRVGTGGAWANVPGGYIADATAGPGIAGGEIPVSVVLPANADDQSNVQVRILTTNAAGYDEWVGIDDIVVTHDHAINKWTGSGLFSTATNWSLGRAPISDDVVVFDGSASNSQCTYDGTSAASSFAYVRLVNSFSGTLRLESSMEVGTVELATGTIDQPTASPFTIGDLFTWTGGTLNSTATLASVYFDGGSMANITPGAGNTIATGSTLVFGNDGVSVGSTGSFGAGILEFRNDAGVEINQFCVAELKDKLELTKVNSGGSQIVINAGGTAIAKESATVKSDIPVSVTGGLLKVEKAASLKLLGTFPPPFAILDQPVSLYMTGGEVRVQGDAFLDLTGFFLATGGQLNSGWDKGTSNIAVITSKAGFYLNGTDIGIMAGRPAQSSFGILRLAGAFFWNNGTFRPVVSTASADSDQLDVDGGVYFGDNTAVAPGALNATGQQEVPAAGRTWNVVRTNIGLNGELPVSLAAWAKEGTASDKNYTYLTLTSR